MVPGSPNRISHPQRRKIIFIAKLPFGPADRTSIRSPSRIRHGVPHGSRTCPSRFPTAVHPSSPRAMRRPPASTPAPRHHHPQARPHAPDDSASAIRTHWSNCSRARAAAPICAARRTWGRPKSSAEIKRSSPRPPGSHRFGTRFHHHVRRALTSTRSRAPQPRRLRFFHLPAQARVPVFPHRLVSQPPNALRHLRRRTVVRNLKLPGRRRPPRPLPPTRWHPARRSGHARSGAVSSARLRYNRPVRYGCPR
jgi:hypothetical protein